MPDHVLAGALYQPVKEVLVAADDDDREAIEAGIYRALRASGIFLNDEMIIKASAPLKVPTRQTSSDVINVLSEDELAEVMERARKSACAVVARMFAGETSPAPTQTGMRSPCEYCGASDACPLDSRLEGGKVRKLGKEE
ncbi:MAG: hypothetical protein Q4G47_06360, partial [Lachnospiraceae bacterium]|nr:hypothetical protein [Lachnospiraceae bacterium]